MGAKRPPQTLSLSLYPFPYRSSWQNSTCEAPGDPILSGNTFFPLLRVLCGFDAAEQHKDWTGWGAIGGRPLCGS